MDNDRYWIMRFSQKTGGKKAKGYGTVTLKEAQKICSDPATRGGNRDKGNAWFLGFTKA